jgi:hypothetical protein
MELGITSVIIALLLLAIITEPLKRKWYKKGYADSATNYDRVANDKFRCHSGYLKEADEIYTQEYTSDYP